MRHKATDLSKLCIRQSEETFGALLSAGPLAAALGSRRRVFTTPVVFWTFLCQILGGGSCRSATGSVQSLLSHLGRGLCSSSEAAYCMARARLPIRMLLSIQSHLAAYMPSSWLSETRRRISAYRELAETLTVEDLDKLAASRADRFGKLPESAANLVDVTRLRLIAGAQGVSSVEIKGQRLMLQRNGDYIMLEGRRFPRLTSTDPIEKLAESIAMLHSL